MTRPLHVVMPMAGAGSRFAAAGFTTPKPLIPVDGMPMFLKAFQSLGDLTRTAKLTLVIQEAHDREHGLAARIGEAMPRATVARVPKLTGGAVETCLAAAPAIAADDGVLVMDCDLWFEAPDYVALMQAVLAGSRALDGGLLTFASDSPRYSYALIEDGRVVRTAEKDPISRNALVGAYFFARGDRFVALARDLVARPLGQGRPEYYVSLLYNQLLAEGGAVGAVPVTRFASFGTPEELAQYEQAGTA